LLKSLNILKQKRLATTNPIIMIFIDIFSLLCFHPKPTAGVESILSYLQYQIKV
jgi:hypothetical protein